LKALLKCHQLAQTPGKPNDPNANSCVDKAQAKYTGGVDPTKGCFYKLEKQERETTADAHRQLVDAAGAGRGLRRRFSNAATHNTTSTSSTTLGHDEHHLDVDERARPRRPAHRPARPYGVL